jgi:hypothetical protein
VLPLSNKRSGYRKLFNFYHCWSYDERHAPERFLNALKNHATTERAFLQFWSGY